MSSKISALNSASTPLTGAELLVLVQGGTNVNCAVSSLPFGSGNPPASPNFTGALYQTGTPQTAATGTYTTIVFSDVAYDSSTFTSSGKTTFTLPAAGYVQLSAACQLQFFPTASSAFEIQLSIIDDDGDTIANDYFYGWLTGDVVDVTLYCCTPNLYYASGATFTCSILQTAVSSMAFAGRNFGVEYKGNTATLPATNPTGTIITYPSATPPTGYLLCDGSAYSTTTYSALYAIIGGTYDTMRGASTPGSGMFRVPNLSGLAVIGAGSAASDPTTSPYTLGSTQGSESVTITQDQLPNINFDAGSVLVDNRSSGSGIGGGRWDGASLIGGVDGGDAPLYLSIPSGGSGDAVSVIQPCIALYYHVKT
jgi:hypothetical protein